MRVSDEITIFRLQQLIRPAAIILAILIVTGHTHPAAASPTSHWEITKCRSKVLRPIAKAFSDESVTLEVLNQRGIPLSGHDQAVMLTLNDGERFIVKPAISTRKNESAAYILAEWIDPGRVPETVTLEISGSLYSVQRFVKSSVITAFDSSGRQIPNPELAKLIRNPLPDEIILFDALIGNWDRAVDRNVLVFSKAEISEPIDLRSGRITLTSPTFIAIDLALAFSLDSLREWSRTYRYAVDVEEFDIQAIARRNPVWIERLRSGDFQALTDRLSPHLAPAQREALERRRSEILALCDPGDR